MAPRTANQPTISVRGAREHNLQNISVELPRDKLIVFTGLSGSGKSSLAFDTIYAEGQRRYVESLSSYARQFLGQMDKPDVDVIEGLSPAISIDQKSASRNPRSTVGTITEVYDYLRLLYARIGVQHCPERRHPARAPDARSRSSTASCCCRRAPGSRSWRRSCGAARASTRRCSRTSSAQGFVRARVDGEVVDIDEFLKRAGAAGPLRAAHDRGRRRPPRAARGHRAPPHRLARDGAQAGRRRRRGRDRAPRGRGAVDDDLLTFSQHLACPVDGRSRSRSRRRATSRSTRPTAPARRATASARRSRSTPSWSSPTPTCRSTTGAIAPWRSAHTQYFTRMLDAVAADATASTSTRRGRR